MPISFKAIRDTGKVIDAAATQAALRSNMKKYCDRLIKSLQGDYDTVPEGPNYIRKYRSKGMRPIGVSFTGRKRRSDYKRGFGVGVGGGWHSSVSGDGNTGEVWNDVPYSAYVQGHHGQQAEHHVDAGWGSIDDHAAALNVYFRQQVGDAIKTGIAKARQNRNRRSQFSEGFG